MLNFFAKLLSFFVMAVFLIWLTSPEPTEQRFVKPWQVEINTDGTTKALGIVLSKTTLGEAQKLFEIMPEAAYILDADGKAVAELFIGHVNFGGVTGKLVLSAPTTEKMPEGWKDKAEVSPLRSQFLALDNWQRFSKDKISTAALIPSKNLTEELVEHSFGKPAEILPEGRNKLHYLYPEIGADVVIHSLGNDVIQFVLPSQFDKIRQPLLDLQKRPE